MANGYYSSFFAANVAFYTYRCVLSKSICIKHLTFKTHRYIEKQKRSIAFELYALFPNLCNYVFNKTTRYT